jgi:hypothetical protein
VWLGVAGLLAQLAIPFLHSLEIRLETSAVGSGLTEGAATANVGTAASEPRISRTPVASHHPESCPICTALSHVHATTAEASQLPLALESGPPVVLSDRRILPVLESASADARAPPAFLIAIS